MAAPFFVALKKISKPPVVVCFNMIRAQVDNFIEVLDGQLILAELTISITPVIVCLDITRVQADGLIIIMDGQLILTGLAVSKSPVVVAIGIIRCYMQSMTKKLNTVFL